MRMEYRRRVFRMELRADIPMFVWNLDYLNEVGSRIDTHAFHTLHLVLLFIGIVELIAMSVSLADEGLLTISPITRQPF